MKIKVYGPGCTRCRQLEQNARQAISELKVAASIEKISDIEMMADAGIMMTPALEIDGIIVSSGKVLSVQEIKVYLK